MKIFHCAALALAIGAASISSVQARDSFSIGINVGGHGYYEPVYYEPTRYYAEPVYYSQPVYYSAPVTYYREPIHYRSVPRYYGYAPSVVSFGYSNHGGHQYNRHHYNRHDRHFNGHHHRGNGRWERDGNDSGGHGHR